MCLLNWWLCLPQQSKFLKLHKEKVISVNAIYDLYSFLIRLLVCNSDILDQSTSSSRWWRGRPWCSCVFSYIFLPTLRFVYNVLVPERSWYKSNSSLTAIRDVFWFCHYCIFARVARILPLLTYNHSPTICEVRHPFLVGTGFFSPYRLYYMGSEKLYVVVCILLQSDQM